MKLEDILKKCDRGELSVEETNEMLKEMGYDMRVDPNVNVIAPGEEDDYGMLDIGACGLMKVRIANMELADSDCGIMPAMCKYKGKWYNVEGKKLVERDDS